MLEEHGVVGPANGSKPREVFGAQVPSDVSAETVGVSEQV